jgi:hypothetical protein
MEVQKIIRKTIIRLTRKSLLRYLYKEKRMDPIKCNRFSHSWNYGGKNIYVIICPHCRTTLSIKKHRILKTDVRSLVGPTQSSVVDRTALESDAVHG